MDCPDWGCVQLKAEFKAAHFSVSARLHPCSPINASPAPSRGSELTDTYSPSLRSSLLQAWRPCFAPSFLPLFVPLASPAGPQALLPAHHLRQLMSNSTSPAPKTWRPGAAEQSCGLVLRLDYQRPAQRSLLLGLRCQSASPRTSSSSLDTPLLFLHLLLQGRPGGSPTSSTLCFCPCRSPRPLGSGSSAAPLPARSTPSFPPPLPPLLLDFVLLPRFPAAFPLVPPAGQNVFPAASCVRGLGSPSPGSPFSAKSSSFFLIVYSTKLSFLAAFSRASLNQRSAAWLGLAVSSESPEGFPGECDQGCGHLHRACQTQKRVKQYPQRKSVVDVSDTICIRTECFGGKIATVHRSERSLRSSSQNQRERVLTGSSQGRYLLTMTDGMVIVQFCTAPT
ncbi:uncharacterized protein LOC144609579 [Rhinoraja longicauda]